MPIPKPVPAESLRISIIVAVFNGVETVQQCIDSVATQTLSDIELIIIDGGSTDGTVDILKANGEKISYWESSPDRGIYHAWNKALAHVSGDWVLFLGADDYLWSDDALERAASHLGGAYPPYRVVYAQVAIINRQGELMYRVGEPWPAVKARFAQLMGIPHQGVIHHRSLFEEHGTFDESFRISGDYELLRRELRGADALFVPDLILAGMRQGGVSSSPQQSLLLLQESRRANRMHGDSQTGLRWWHSYIRVRARMLLWKLLGEQNARKILDAGRRLLGRPAHWTRT